MLASGQRLCFDRRFRPQSLAETGQRDRTLGRNEREVAVPEYRVIVPLDGSKLAEHSLAYVPALKHFGTPSVLLISVVDEKADLYAANPQELADREFNVVSTYLREVAANLESMSGVNVVTEVVRGDPPECILDAVARFSADLLVISTHGRSGISRWRLGSVADKVIRSAACDTLVVGPRTGETASAFKAVLLPLDGSELAEQAIPAVKKFAAGFGSAVHIVRVVQIPTPVVDVTVGGGYYVPDVLEALQETAEDYVAKAARLFDPSTAVTTQVIIGYPSTELENYVTQHGIDLVIATSHGRGGIARAALGSVTDRLLGGTAPILVVRARPQGT
jgi:nucleotide-binding universal stress UspA family protein